MKKQIKLRWQALTYIAYVGLVIMFAVGPSAIAQTTYKVGDHVEVMSAGVWVEAEIIKVEENGDYSIRYVESGISGAWAQAKHLRPIKAKAPANDQNNADNADNKGKNQTNGNNGVDNPTNKQKPAQAAKTNQTDKTNRFGAREPRTCSDCKAPSKGPITASFALKYLKCQMEKVWSNNLYLVENVKVQVGGGVPYDPALGAFEAINVRVPLYPIRGSYLQYQCDDLVLEHVGPPDTNCTTYSHPKATGYCYKTTFGDWRCHMADTTSTNKENVRTGVAPPKPLQNQATKQKPTQIVKNKPAAKAKQTAKTKN